MDKKILNAINKGVLRALSTDIDDQNIDFNKTDIDSNYTYKVTFNELLDIFNEDPEDIFNYDTTSCVLLILDDKTEIPLSKYYKKEGRAKFIKIMNPPYIKNVMTDSIIISTDVLINPTVVWQTKSTMKFDNTNCIQVKDKEALYKDFNGYRNTYHNLNIKYNADGTFTDNNPAFQYLDELNDRFPGYKAYMPSTGQMVFIFKYLKFINYLLIRNGGASIPTATSPQWQTSTEPYWQSKICIKNRLGQLDEFETTFKRTSNKLLPLFKKI